MTPLQTRVVNDLIGSTGSIVDLSRNLAARLYGRAQGIEREVLSLIVERRLSWLDWQTMTQRQWQTKTRNPAKAMHHDSVAIREQYVRCKGA